MSNPMNSAVGASAETDLGLRSFMLGTYRYMALAMAVTAGVAWFGAPYFEQLPFLDSPFALLGFVFAIPVLFGVVGRKLPSMSLGGVLAFLFGFAAFIGVFVSFIALRFDAAVIFKIFFMTVAMFGALSLFGYTTQRNLGTFVKYAFAAFSGYIAINLLGAFYPALRPTGPLDIIINVVGLGAIAMITAWQTQSLKRIYYGNAGNPAMEGKLAAFGAASLLLAFINLFQILLSLFGRD